ncbi:MAG: hypothetical protein P4L81_02805 [Candidatus Pacebacteria bacterium]|nr:hypothetical protein [Candidatus Paceibacterota bacterium]
MSISSDWGTVQQVHAAWIQAIGSIGAILVAIVVPTALWLSDRRRSRRAEINRLRAVGAITQLALDALRRLDNEATSTSLPGATGVSVEAFHDIQNAADAIDSIRIDALGSPTLVANVTAIRRCVRRMRGLIPDFLPPEGPVLTYPFDYGALVREAEVAQAAIAKEVGQ